MRNVEALVSVVNRLDPAKSGNRHLNRHLGVVRQAGSLENSGAGEGNQTLFISLGS